jgi:hypothetical protein
MPIPPACSRATMPRRTDPDRRAYNVVVGLILLGMVCAWLAECAGYDVVQMGEPIDAEQAWRDRAGR